MYSIQNICSVSVFLTGAGPSLLNQPGLSQPCRSWNMQPCSVSTWKQPHIQSTVQQKQFVAVFEELLFIH